MAKHGKTLSEWARDYYDGAVDEKSYRQHRAEILDHLEDGPVIDMDATLPLARKGPDLAGERRAEPATGKPAWLPLALVAVLLVALAALLIWRIGA